MSPTDSASDETAAQGRTQTDGGLDNDGEEVVDLFHVSEAETVTVSPSENVFRLLDFYFYTPLRIAWADWRARIGIPIVTFYLLMATLGVAVISEPAFNEGPKLLSPFVDPQFPLGTDAMGRSIGKQLVHSTPAMLKMAAAGGLFTGVMGLLMGLISGYKGGQIDRAMMTFSDIVMTIPRLPMILFLTAIFVPKDPFVVGVLLSVTTWPGLTRAVRSEVLQLRENEYVEAARAMDMPTSYILTRDVVPSIAPYVLLNSLQSAVGVIGAAVALYFLGILPFTTLNWGVMMNLAQTTGGAIANPARAGHWLFFPAITLALLGFGVVMFAQGMDRVFNPRLRARHAKTASSEEGEEEPTNPMS